jgi:hypothetical protein
MPTENVHRVGTGAPAKEAGLYEEQMRDLAGFIFVQDRQGNRAGYWYRPKRTS